MASAPSLTEMEQEAMCPICQEWLTDPEVLDCGHSFCQGCITKHCDTWEALEEEVECPTCKFKIQKGGLRRNWQLANLVEKMKLMSLSSGKEDLCLKHKEKFHLFCKEDEQLVCVVCQHSPEHQGHTTLLLEEAAQQYKDKIFNSLETLRTEKEEILEYIQEVKDESQEMLKRMESVRLKSVAEFRTLHYLLNEQEKDLLAQIEDKEKEIARKRDQQLARLSEKLSSLKSLFREMEEKHHQTGSQLLQDVRGTLQRYEKKETFVDQEVIQLKLKWRIDGCRYNPFLENAMVQFKDTLNWAFPKLRAKVTLDPASASSHLILGGDQKTMQWPRTAQVLSEVPETCCGIMLGSEGFTTGCQFWEVHVAGEGWAVGVAKKPVRGRVTLTPEEGIWAVGRWKGQYKAFVKGSDPPLTLRGDLRKIRVCLDYDEGRVVFFDAKRAALLYEFSGAFFAGKTLHPFFTVYGDGWLWLFS